LKTLREMCESERVSARHPSIIRVIPAAALSAIYAPRYTAPARFIPFNARSAFNQIRYRLNYDQPIGKLKAGWEMV